MYFKLGYYLPDRFLKEREKCHKERNEGTEEERNDWCKDCILEDACLRLEDEDELLKS